MTGTGGAGDGGSRYGAVDLLPCDCIISGSGGGTAGLADRPLAAAACPFVAIACQSAGPATCADFARGRGEELESEIGFCG